MTLVCVQASQWKISPTMKVQSMTIQKLLKLNVLKIPKAKRIVNKSVKDRYPPPVGTRPRGPEDVTVRTRAHYYTRLK
jgi:hypothetical protein